MDVQSDFCHSDSPLAKIGFDMTAAQDMVPNLVDMEAWQRVSALVG